MSRIWNRIQHEPALLVGLVTAVLSLLVAFGVDLSDERQAAIIAVVIAVGAIIVRQAVTPNIAVGAHEDDQSGYLDSGTLVAGEASSIPNDTPVDVVRKDEFGHGSSSTLITVAAVLVIIVCLVWLLSRLL